MFRSEHHQALSAAVGVGLRHPHYQDALSETAGVDFVEVHSENFFAPAGATREFIRAVSERYPISLHGTSLGLGSAEPINTDYIQRLKNLTDDIRPFAISDHASFSWSRLNGRRLHAGDLLPLPFIDEASNIMAENIDRVQQILGQQLLLENLVSYIQFKQSPMSEMEFLTKVAEQSGCALLLDINNLLVNAHNQKADDPLQTAKQWIDELPNDLVKEFHLAGYSPVAPGQLIIDDHSQAVNEECWTLFDYALDHFSPQTTLIEWDNQLPDWQRLQQETERARRHILQHVQRQSISGGGSHGLPTSVTA